MYVHEYPSFVPTPIKAHVSILIFTQFFRFFLLKGSDVEDSLYWIAYATQPSNIKLHSVDPSPLVLPEKEGSNEGADGGAGGK